MSFAKVYAEAGREPVAVRAKKGDAIVIETHSSSTDAKTFKVNRYTYYKIARCAKADRKGVVTHIEFPDSPVYMLDKTQRVICIGDPDRQEAAKRLYAKVRDNFFNTRDDIKKAILEA